jgi:GT2 family glycosyltransferase
MAVGNKNTFAPEISVAVIAMNCLDDVRRLLESLSEPLKAVSHEIVFVDNASTDGTVEMLKTEYPEIILIENSENNGVAPARNQALKKCGGRYVFIVDADCEYKEGDFKLAISYLEKNPDVAVLGFRLYYPNGEIQDTGRTLPTPLDLIINRLDSLKKIRNCKTFKQHRMRDFDPMKLREAGFVAGASQFFARKLPDEIGYLDENMFYGYEDSDFCARVIRSGKKVVYFPFIVIMHHHQRLTKKKPLSRMAAEQMKSYGIFHRKHGKMLGRINRDLRSNNNPPPFLR